MTPLKAIRAKCLDCCGGQKQEVKRCPCEDCTLRPFRFGKNPNMANRKLSGRKKETLIFNSYAKKPR